MKNYFVLGAAVCLALSLASCKSKESAYKKAYEKAKQNQVNTQAPVATTQTPVTVAPTQAAPTTPVTSNEATRTETLELVNGTGLRAYSVVVGSFSIQTNAQNLQRTLVNAGYSAQIARNPQGMYRVIASTFDDLNSAVSSRNVLRQQYPDAWLLRK